jgi:hypothetical protein
MRLDEFALGHVFLLGGAGSISTGPIFSGSGKMP